MIDLNRPLFFIFSMFFKSMGIIALLLLKVRSWFQNYRRPRVDSSYHMHHAEKAFQYDFHVFQQWMKHLEGFAAKENASLVNKSVLELCPGSDIGQGFLSLVSGASKYTAIDIHNLAQLHNVEFYAEFLHYIAESWPDRRDKIRALFSDLESILSGNNDQVRYIHSSTFNIADSIPAGSVDIIFSQAAFEHFDNPERAFSDLNIVAKRGAILIAEIDLKTHTRWIRDIDPLNIYRFNDAVYSAFRYKGAPNRMRPFEYVSLLERNGWGNISVMPLTDLKKKQLDAFLPGLNQRFLPQRNQMALLTVALIAQKI